jgi:hypothetical protein
MSEPSDSATPSEDDIARVRELAERELTVEGFNAYVNAPMSRAELEGIWESIDWFCRRYPTVLERARLFAARVPAMGEGGRRRLARRGGIALSATGGDDRQRRCRGADPPPEAAAGPCRSSMS